MTSPSPFFLQRVSNAIHRWAAEQRRREQDAQYWQTALGDPRIMADINCALARSDCEGAARPIVIPTRPEQTGLVAATHALSH